MGALPKWKELWTEHRPEPKDLTDTEIVNFLNESCEEYSYHKATEQCPAGYTLFCDGVETTEPTLRKAVALAAAKDDEANL